MCILLMQPIVNLTTSIIETLQFPASKKIVFNDFFGLCLQALGIVHFCLI